MNLIKRMWSDGSVVSCSHEHLEGQGLPLGVSTQLQRQTHAERLEANSRDPGLTASSSQRGTQKKVLLFGHLDDGMSCWGGLHSSSAALRLVVGSVMRPGLDLYSQLVLVKLGRQRPVERRQSIRPKINMDNNTTEMSFTFTGNNMCSKPHQTSYLNRGL